MTFETSDRPYRQPRRYWFLGAYKTAVLRLLSIILLTYVFATQMINRQLARLPDFPNWASIPPALIRELQLEINRIYWSFGLDPEAGQWSNFLTYVLDRLTYEPILIFIVGGAMAVILAEAYQRLKPNRYER